MNMNLFLQQESKVLRAENKRKVKKKARARGKIGDDLFLSIDEGQNRVQQLNMQPNEHLDEPTPRASQRAPRRCSGCGAIGHTIRS